jgi:hypothetical protein
LSRDDPVFVSPPLQWPADRADGIAAGDWARDETKLLVTSAFAPSPIRFREAFRIAVQCRLANAGVADARAEFDRTVRETREGAARLRNTRWESDSWGNYCRRFACLAEGAALALKDQPLANELLNEATMLPVGFAGYHAPASLALAEANAIVRPVDAASSIDCSSPGAKFGTQRPGPGILRAYDSAGSTRCGTCGGRNRSPT